MEWTSIEREREGREMDGRDNRDSTNAAPRIFVDIEWSLVDECPMINAITKFYWLFGDVARSRSTIFIVSTVSRFRFVARRGRRGGEDTFFFDGETEFHFEERSWWRTKAFWKAEMESLLLLLLLLVAGRYLKFYLDLSSCNYIFNPLTG